MFSEKYSPSCVNSKYMQLIYVCTKCSIVSVCVCVMCVCVCYVVRKRGKLGEKERVQIVGGFCPFHLHVAAQVSMWA